MGFNLLKVVLLIEIGFEGLSVIWAKAERESIILSVQPAVEILSGALLHNLNAVMMIISSSSC